MVSEPLHADPARVEPPRDDRTTESTTVLELEGVSKQYGSETAVADLSLSVRDGELLTLLGPSGCGKTTTLRTIAGLERPDGGTIRIGDGVVAGDRFVAPEDRDVGIVFQDFALFPHLSAAENVGFGLEDRDEATREARVDELLGLVGLREHADSTPGELSGGQKQRVALARSLAIEPEILLLDEPFSNLDVDLRVEMREEVRRILKGAGVTAISVTHDREEAMSISDRVAVMNDGRLMQVGHPEEVFQHPESRFVAGFLGHASFLPSSVLGDAVETPLGRIGRDRLHGLAPEPDRFEIDVLVRPDDVLVRPAEAGEADGRVTYRRHLGPTVLYRVELENGDVVEAMHNHSERVELGAPVAVELDTPHDLTWFPPADR